MLRDFIGIRVNRAKNSGMVNITSSVNSRERSGINTILHELNPLFTINVTMRDIKFFFSSRRRHTRSYGDWSSDVCSSDLPRQCEARAVVDGDGQVLRELVQAAPPHFRLLSLLTPAGDVTADGAVFLEGAVIQVAGRSAKSLQVHPDFRPVLRAVAHHAQHRLPERSPGAVAMFVGPGHEFCACGLSERLVDWELGRSEDALLAQRLGEFSPHPVRAIKELAKATYRRAIAYIEFAPCIVTS